MIKVNLFAHFFQIFIVFFGILLKLDLDFNNLIVLVEDEMAKTIIQIGYLQITHWF